MSSANWIRLGGTAGVVGGLLWVLFPLSTALVSLEDTQPGTGLPCHGRLILAHGGSPAAAAVVGWPDGAARPLRRSLRAAREGGILGALRRARAHVLRQRRGGRLAYVQW